MTTKKSIAIIICGMIVLFFALKSSPESNASEQMWVASSVEGANEITCTYPQLLSASYTDSKVSQELSKPETNPMIFTFSDMDKETSKIKFIDATRTISEIPIIKIAETDELILFVEGTGDPYFTVHTIHKKSGVSTYSKQSTLIGIPVGALGMGTCVGY